MSKWATVRLYVLQSDVYVRAGCPKVHLAFVNGQAVSVCAAISASKAHSIHGTKASTSAVSTVAPHQIRMSNGPAIHALLGQHGYTECVQDHIVDELDELRTRFWLATSIHRDPNNYVYYGNRKGQFIGLWRYSEVDAELRLRSDGVSPRSIYQFSRIHGELKEPELETRIFEPRKRPWNRSCAILSATPSSIMTARTVR